MKSVFGAVTGSFLFGTSVSGSDLDVRGVHIPSRNDIAFQRVSASNTLYSGESDALAEARAVSLAYNNNADTSKVDILSMPLHQFLMLVAGGEVTSMDLCFAPSAFWINSMVDTNVWDVVTALRPKIVTSNVTRAYGFCRNTALQFGVRADRLSSAIVARDMFEGLVREFGGYTTLVAVKDRILELTKLKHIEYVDDDTTDHFVPLLRVCDRGLQLTSPLKHALEILQGLVTGYGKRAQQSQNPQKQDWKSVMHAQRVATQMVELLETGNITFPRPDAPELLKIRNGDYDMKMLTAQLEDQMKLLHELSAKSSLPATPDMEALEALVTDLYME